MTITETETLITEQKSAVLELWNREYPESLNYENIDSFGTYFAALGDQKHYLAIEEERTIAWAFAFIRDGERWFAIIVTEDCKGRGVGRGLIQKLKEDNEQLSGWVIDKNDSPKINGEPYQSPLAFYLKNGFKLVPGIRLETERMSALKIGWRKNAHGE